jgi:hypothetical protein
MSVSGSSENHPFHDTPEPAPRPLGGWQRFLATARGQQGRRRAGPRRGRLTF